MYYNSKIVLKQFSFLASYYFLLFGSHDLLDTLFSNNLNLCSSPKHDITYKFKLHELGMCEYSSFCTLQYTPNSHAKKAEKTGACYMHWTGNAHTCDVRHGGKRLLGRQRCQWVNIKTYLTETEL